MSATDATSQRRAKRTVSIALLVADTPPQPVTDSFGAYPTIYSRWLHDSLRSIPRYAWQDEVELRLTPFDVVRQQRYPDDAQLRDGLWDAVVVTGSAASAYAAGGEATTEGHAKSASTPIPHDAAQSSSSSVSSPGDPHIKPWIANLIAWIANLAQEHPLVRIVGVCFGHQIVAAAFGAKVALNPMGWELGVYDVQLTEQGREWLGYADTDVMPLQQVHRDAVVSLPTPYPLLNLGSTPQTATHVLLEPYPADVCPPLPSSASSSDFCAFDVADASLSSLGPGRMRAVHVFSVQGHPEFHRDLVVQLIDARTEMGSITGALREQGLRRCALRHDGLRVGRLVWAMLGVEARRLPDDGDDDDDDDGGGGGAAAAATAASVDATLDGSAAATASTTVETGAPASRGGRDGGEGDAGVGGKEEEARRATEMLIG